MKKDFFLGIGAQRGGTTWLGVYCQEHPQIGFTFPKELHYFDAVYRPDICGTISTRRRKELEELKQVKAEDLSNVDREYLFYLEHRMRMLDDESVYISFVESFARDSHKVLGEITPSYSLLTEYGFKAIKKLIPQTTFVFILRDPVDRLWSHLRFAQDTREEPFDALANVLPALQNKHFVLRTDYKRTLEELRKVVPEEDICILFYEHLFNPENSASELKRFCDFLKIDFKEGDIQKKHNTTPNSQLAPEHVSTITNRFSHVYDYVFKNFPERAPGRWKKNYESRLLTDESFF